MVLKALWDCRDNRPFIGKGDIKNIHIQQEVGATAFGCLPVGYSD